MIFEVICPSERSIMNNLNKGNGRHLTLSDRTFIEQELIRGSTFRSIAEALRKDPSTISKEIRLHSFMAQSSSYKVRKCKNCRHFPSCKIFGLCNEILCREYCGTCSYNRYANQCERFDPFKCPKILKPPYVCNPCEKKQGCHDCKRYYSALKAQKEYEKNLSESRKGINMSLDELQELNDLISPLILKGQPLSHIFAVHSEDIPVCRRTLYNYLDQRVFQARNIDLPRRVRYKKRKRSTTPRTQNLNQVYRNRRTYKDFERYLEAHPDTDVVEMDTVKGTRDTGKCLLTLLFRSCSFMLVILLPKCTQECVIRAINDLTETIGIRLFRKYFPVILTDNGSEFKNPYDIEKTPDGKHRTYVFYCDPYVSNQKARLEKNHEYIRYVIPKGQSMYRYTQDDINLMTSHINSTARDSLNGNSPFDLAELLLDKKIPILTGLHKVSPDSVMLKPALIEHASVKSKH